MEGTRKATDERERPKGPRLPWVSTMEPTVFWGIVILLQGFGMLVCGVVVALAAWEAVDVLKAIEAVLRGR